MKAVAVKWRFMMSVISHVMLQDMQKGERAHLRSGFTLIELLLTISIIAVIAGVVIVAVSPRKNFVSARDSERVHSSKQLQQAIYANLIDTWELAGEGSIPECTRENAETCARPICKDSIFDVTCLANPAIPLRTLPPTYISELPVDVVMSDDANCIGYMAYQESGRPHVFSANMGKLEGDTPEGMCGTGGNGEVGFWDFDEGGGTVAYDLSPNGNDGILFETDASNWVEGNDQIRGGDGRALYFDEGGYIEIPNPSDYFPTTPKTYCGWVKSGERDYNVFVGFSNAGVTPLIEWHQSDSGQPLIYLGPDNYRYFSLEAGNTLKDGDWHHVCFYVAGIQQNDILDAKMWLDGEEVASGSTYYANPPSAFNKFYIGKSIGFRMKAAIDDVRVFNRALLPEEITQLANGF